MSDHHDHDDDDDLIPRPRCNARTRGGRGPQCKRDALDGHDRCASHTYRVPGRPSKLTAALSDTIIREVLDGAYIEVAAQAAGVNVTTLYRWLRRADEAEAVALEHITDPAAGLDAVYNHAAPEDWPYLDFRHALKSAEAAAELATMRELRAVAAAGGKWQAFGYLLERRHPDRWRRRESADVTFGGEVVKRVEVIAPDDHERAAVLARLNQAGALDETDPRTENAEEDPTP